MKRALDSVNERILAAVNKRPQHALTYNPPRLVAVSKLKPVAAIIEAYDCGQRYFGENYIQELEEKSNSSEILEKCPEIKFHFIGHLQSNKVNKLLKVRNLHMMETVDSEKLANLINNAIGRSVSGETRPDGDLTEPDKKEASLLPESAKLKVMIQVNTSGEEQKNGIQPNEAPDLAEHIARKCNWLELAGIMTIGKFEGWNGPNQDFLRLFELREVIAKRLSLEPHTLELSMGMSGDFEEAIIQGSTSVRVGTLIFGERPSKN